ncbi:ABC transporter, TroCD-like [Acididesulfobacillus acetoxydans]|uniref:ABC transporter, TroCD-like n=1 Tax=Acididesulfobacillus acetoxydans TaxID=1561005 RepID=A0A8S0XC39_9FIRM|nr:metal ABC transporter permease [Acididesulfobacillus acetoxydans]CAA7601976.1 ABC transporter, TroCD-like [Acididesulfobacillus acetoxydans]CEJ08180.1 ABC-type transporter, integral membrane subunit [Acididesulfobacillus acetoxydans]
MTRLGELLFAPGFFQSAEVTRALLLGSMVAAISGLMGVFVVIRGQAFIAHALADFGGAGAAVAFLVRINPVWGFLTFGVLAATGVEFLGKRAGERDLSTGIVLSVALGVESLFLYLDTHYTGHAGAPMLILFGSIFLVAPFTVPIIMALTVTTGVTLDLIYRPLLLSSIDPELARIRGVPVQAMSLIFVILLSLVVEEGSLMMGALLSISLLIGPAAAATHLTHRMGWAMLWSALLGITAMWMGIVLAYDSFYWPPAGRGWPVSFFICVLVLLFYLLARLSSQRSQVKVRVARKCDA